ncbi:MAG: polysaccharide biosynthesis protein [Lachnospiraceae bacterium]|nr:polysaccharide biosynthesis protein [Lachnospiraceae bacterium]
MNQKRFLMKGTLLLTVMGLLTRVAGFFYKIFLSRTIGASEIGLYQMAIPVFSFCSALCGGGIQTAISKLTAKYHARRSQSGAKQALFAGLFLSLSLSVILMAALYFGTELIAERILLEKSCAGLLKIMAFSLPFSMIHGCICGYFMGTKHIVPPALAQFAEQIVRILFVVLAYTLSFKKGRQTDASLMAFGALAGEAASAIYCVVCLFILSSRNFQPENPASADMSFSGKLSSLHLTKHRIITSLRSIPNIPSLLRKWGAFRHQFIASVRQILPISVPLSLNRTLMCVLQAIEAALLPQILRLSGLTASEALSVYGTLTGMALPMILFPTAITSALGMLLLPTVSEAQALHQQNQLARTVNASFLGSLLLGSFCLGGFLLFGSEIGSILFQNAFAGTCIRRLALLCPLIYISTTLTSILHGLGKSTVLLLWNLGGFALRLLCVICLVPPYGISGYLFGLLLDQTLLAGCILFSLYRQNILTVSIPGALTRMFFPAVTAGGCTFLFFLLSAQKIPAQICLIIGGGIYCIIFLLTVLPAFTGSAASE